MKKIIEKIKNFFSGSFSHKLLQDIEQYDDVYIQDNDKILTGFCLKIINEHILAIYCWETDSTHIINISNDLDKDSIIFEDKILYINKP
jgi:hypothetical protein